MFQRSTRLLWIRYTDRRICTDDDQRLDLAFKYRLRQQGGREFAHQAPRSLRGKTRAVLLPGPRRRIDALDGAIDVDKTGGGLFSGTPVPGANGVQRLRKVLR